jgi:GNAT superfamily N-acetyltransferase
MDINLLDWRHDLWNKYYTADSRGEIAFTAEEKAYLDEMKASGAVHPRHRGAGQGSLLLL